jgi:hypothetical protein
VEYINPLFNEKKITKSKNPTPKLNHTSKKARATRSDKQHNIKFPVSSVIQVKLKSYHRQAKRIYQLHEKGDITQTKFNTLLLKYGLNHPNILRWDFEYQDTKVYMHTNLLEVEYEREIGGPFGLTIQKNLSDRKVVHHILLSVLKWLERGGSIEEIL